MISDKKGKRDADMDSGNGAARNILYIRQSIITYVRLADFGVTDISTYYTLENAPK